MLAPPPVPSSLALLLPEPPSVYPAAKGTVQIWEPAPRILVSRVVGMLTAEGASAIELSARRMTSKYGKLIGFHDWELMTDYEPAARARLVQLGVELLKTTEAIHIYSTSKLVQLGVRTASVAVRGIHMCLTRGALELALQRALADSRR